MAARAFALSPISKWALTSVVVLALGTGAVARDRAGVEAFAAPGEAVALAELPRAARETYQAILSGGPFRFDKDGSTFGNRERLLPRMQRGYYREYTVVTPGARDRGARRIVCGGGHPPEVCWYTADHYASFRRITP